MDAPTTAADTASAIQIRVIETPHHLPVAGAKVRISGFCGPFKQDLVSDTSGTALLQPLLPGEYEVSHIDTGASGYLQVSQGETENITLRSGTRSLWGQVKRADEPIKKPKVLLVFDAGGGAREVIGDGNGYYRLDKLPAAPATVSVFEQTFVFGGVGYKKKSYQDRVDLTTGSVELCFSLPGGTIRAMVVDEEGRPARNAIVALREAGGVSSLDIAYHLDATFQIGGHKFTHGRIGAGRYGLVAWDAEGGSGAVENVEVPSDGESDEVTIKLRRGGGRIVSVLRDSDGKPVNIWRNLSNATGKFPASSQADSDGVCVLDHIPAGTYTLEIRRVGYSTVTHTFTIQNGETLRFEDEVISTGEFVWELDSLSGQSLLELPCTLTPITAAENRKSHTGRYSMEGDWRVSDAAPGDYLASVTLPDGRVFTEKVTITANNTTGKRTTLP